MPMTRPTIDELIEQSESEFESRFETGGPLLPTSDLKVLARVLAGFAHELYGAIAATEREIRPDTASADELDRRASLYGVFRLLAQQASGPCDFTGTAAAIVPADTQLVRGDGLLYRVTADVTIGGGGTGSGTIEAVEAGDAPAGTSLTLATPVAGIDDAAAVGAGGITNGSDVESDESLRARLILRLQAPPQGGALTDYIARAKTVAEVTRVFPKPLYLGAGTVGVFFTTDDDPAGPIPSGATVAEVEAALTADEWKPVTASISVFAPVEQEVDMTIGLAPNTVQVQEAVTAQLEDLFRRQAEVGVDFLRSKITAASSTSDGEDDHDLVSPAADVVVAAGNLPVLGTLTFQSL